MYLVAGRDEVVGEAVGERVRARSAATWSRPIVLGVFWTAGVRYCSRPPSSLGETSAVDWAIHGSPAVIVGPSCLTPGQELAGELLGRPERRVERGVGATPSGAAAAGSSAIVWLELLLARGQRGHRRVERVHEARELLAAARRAPRNTSELPLDRLVRSCGWVPSSASLTIAEARNAPAE